MTAKAQQAVHARFHELATDREAQFADCMAAATTDYARGELQHNLQRAIDADWRHCVQMFPGLLDQYYAAAERTMRRGLDGLTLDGGEECPVAPSVASLRWSGGGWRGGGGGGGGRHGGRLGRGDGGGGGGGGGGSGSGGPHDEWWFVPR